MTETLPAPLTPADCDLRSFGFMPLDVARLLTSEWWINALEEQPEACGPAVNLWGTSWHQVPAASLPDSEAVLRRIAGVTRETWERVRARVLQPWVKCSDGRIYHPVVAEKALEAIALKKRKSEGGKLGNKRRWGSDTDRSPIAEGSDQDASPIDADRYPAELHRKERQDRQTRQTDKTEKRSSAREGFQVEADPALIVIEAFDQALTDAYGPERRRPFPAGTDIVFAKRWLAEGLKPQDLYQFFLARQRARKAAGKDPIGSLAFLENAVAELGGTPAPTAPGAAPSAGNVRFLTPEQEIRARQAWWSRDAAAAKARGEPAPRIKEYGIWYDAHNGQETRLMSGERPPIPPAPPQEGVG